MENNNYEKERSLFYENFSKFTKIEDELVTLPIIKALEEKLVNLNDKSWLDYGCGNWFTTNIVHKKWAFLLWVDNSIDQIEKAKKRESEWIKFIHIQNNDIPFIEDGSLDFCYFRFSTCEMSDEIINCVMRNVNKKLKNGGIIVIWDQNRESCLGRETMSVCYSPYKKHLKEWEYTTTMLKRYGVKFIWNEERLIENIDFIPIPDCFRSKKYIKSILEKNGFLNIEFNEIKLDKDNPIECMDEKIVPMYKITIARK